MGQPGAWLPSGAPDGAVFWPFGCFITVQTTANRVRHTPQQKCRLGILNGSKPRATAWQGNAGIEHIKNAGMQESYDACMQE